MADKVMGFTTNPGRMLHSTAISSTAGASIKLESTAQAQPALQSGYLETVGEPVPLPATAEPAQGEWEPMGSDEYAEARGIAYALWKCGAYTEKAYRPRPAIDIIHAALAAARREGMEAACRAVCEGCANGDKLAFYHSSESVKHVYPDQNGKLGANPAMECTAAPIRQAIRTAIGGGDE